MPWATNTAYMIEQYDGTNGATLLDQIENDPTTGGLAVFTNVHDSAGVLTFDWSLGGGASQGYGEGAATVNTGDWITWQYGGIDVYTDAYVQARVLIKE